MPIRNCFGIAAAILLCTATGLVAQDSSLVITQGQEDSATTRAARPMYGAAQKTFFTRHDLVATGVAAAVTGGDIRRRSAHEIKDYRRRWPALDRGADPNRCDQPGHPRPARSRSAPPHSRRSLQLQIWGGIRRLRAKSIPLAALRGWIRHGGS